MEYQAKDIEAKWQDFWDQTGYNEPKNNTQDKKKYILSMFPYPSGRIHMGHVRNYSIGDAIARYYRKEGFNVLHPIGWDSFGMPAENAAIKHKTHPKKWTYENIDYMRGELKSLGFSFSKRREFATSDEDYTKAEQAFFIDMYEKGLVYKKESLVNWCEDCGTVLANEQVEDGACWRCANEVQQKYMSGYYLSITKYAQELLDDLKKLEGNWPKQVLTMQENWIGRSEGLEFAFNIEEKSQEILNHSIKTLEVYTTRADTIYGVTYVAIAPEHEIVNYLIKHELLDKQIILKIEEMKKLSAIQKQSSKKEGFNLGLHVIHPLTKAKIPIWVANFVLSQYGSGAVMSVPAHDQRDFEFAKEFGLAIKQSIKDPNAELRDDEAFIQDGILVDSGEFTGLKSKEAREEIIKYFEAHKIGKAVVNYRLRDWGISRQRYWGAPIPMLTCPKCGLISQPKDKLPILLPEDITITGQGNPLENHPSWSDDICHKCGSHAKRETDTMDTFFQSSWYFFRYATNPEDWEKEAFSKEQSDYWLSVDQYIGGIEHAIMHLLYARFFTKVLRDLNYTQISEPFSKLLTQGMVLKDGSKMSKSKGNTVDPDDIIAKYGADTARLFILFAAPVAKELEWNDSAVEGAYKFIKRLALKSQNAKACERLPEIDLSSLNKEEKYARKKIYEALEKSNSLIKDGTFAFNTLIASCMEALNALGDQNNQDIWTEGYFIILNILEPIIPHVSWELSQKLFKRNNFTHINVDPESLKNDKLSLVLTINGKKRADFEVELSSSKEEIISFAKSLGSKYLQDKQIIKEIYVPNKLVNIVIK